MRSVSAPWPRAAIAIVCSVAGIGASLAANGALAQQTSPGNDDFANAAALVGFPTGADGTLCGATAELDQPQGLREPIWFSFTASSTAPIEIGGFRSGGSYLELRVFSGDTLSTLSEVDLDRVRIPSEVDSPRKAYVLRNPQAGVTYHLAVNSTIKSDCSDAAVRVEVGPEVTAKTNKNRFKPRFPINVAPGAVSKATFTGSFLFVPASGTNRERFRFAPVTVTGKKARSPAALMRLAKKSDCDRLLRDLSSNKSHGASASGQVRLTGPTGSVTFPWVAFPRILSASDRDDIRAGAGSC